MVPWKLGGVKTPSQRDALILLTHQGSVEEIFSGTREMVENGCVGELCSPGMSDCGTGRSWTGNKGTPVSRLSTNTCPILGLITIAGVPSFQVKRVGCEATS